MKYAVDVPHFGEFADARVLADLAKLTETAGWDGFFIWDHVAMDWPDPVVDVTVALTAIAMSTERIRFGGMVTPLPRRRPWKFARETVTLDRLSAGRLTVGVGIGIHKAEFDYLGEAPDFKTRAAMLDEGLDVLTGLWAGKQWDVDDLFSYEGEYYTVHDQLFWPKPLQEPRIPIWVAGMWPNRAPFRRAARWDGVVPIHRHFPDKVINPDDTRDILRYIMEHRQADASFDVTSFDVAVSGTTAGKGKQEAIDHMASYAAAGATWWLEEVAPIHFDFEPGPGPWPMDRMRDHIAAGPPRV